MTRHVGHADYQAISQIRRDSTYPVNQNENAQQLMVMSKIHFRHQTWYLRYLKITLDILDIPITARFLG